MCGILVSYSKNQLIDKDLFLRLFPLSMLGKVYNCDVN